MKACGSKTDQLFNDHWEFPVYIGDNKKLNTKLGQHHDLNNKPKMIMSADFTLIRFVEKLNELLLQRVFFLC